MERAIEGARRLSQRSLLLPGLWWNPETSGNGLDVHLSGNTLGLLWYTYREDGSATWYVAGGDFNADGVVEAELLEPTWGEGGLSTEVIGSIKVTRQHAERAAFEYRIGTEEGSWSIVPVQYTAKRPEVDPSGAYYLPESSGFGLSVDQFGELQTAVYYAFDAQGKAQWLLGVREGNGEAITFERFHRSCPRCTSGFTNADASLPASLETVSGQATLHFDGTPTLLPATFAAPAPLTLLTLPASARDADFRPARFDDAAALKQFVSSSMLDPEVWNWSDQAVDFSPAPPPATPPQSSTTNLVEAGVDEADRVKTDGMYVYVYDEALKSIKIGRRLDPSTPHLTSSLAPMVHPLASGSQFHDGQMFVNDDRLVFLATESSAFFFDPSIAICPPPPEWWLQAKTAVRIYDRTGDKRLFPELIWSADIDGQLITARLIDNQLYLVQRFTPFVNGFVYHGASIPQREANSQLLAALDADDLLPKITQGETSAPWLAAERVSLPPSADRRAQPDFTVVSRINLQEPGDRESVGLVNGVSAIYVSPDAIFLATSRQDQSQLVDASFAPEEYASSEIHRIRLGQESLSIDASGAVDGWLSSDPLLQPFRLSEHEGVLRVLTVDQLGASGMNLLTQLGESAVTPGLLKTLSVLPNAEHPEPIGKPYESLYASRFVGDRLYASTFRVIDPFYVVDLSDPLAPKVAGEVELPGFAEYLHPVNEDLVLGVGYDADPFVGIRRGIKLSLFNVSDPAQPRVVDERIVGERGSASALFSSHHAFSALRLEDGRLRIGVPIRVHGEPEPENGDDSLNSRPFTLGGLHAFDVVDDAQGGHLDSLGVLVTARAGSGGTSWDDSGYSARSILFPSGVIYVTDDKAWTAFWQTLDLPQGPM